MPNHWRLLDVWSQMQYQGIPGRAQRPSPANLSTWGAEAGGLKLIWLHSESEETLSLEKQQKYWAISYANLSQQKSLFPHPEHIMGSPVCSLWNLCLWGHFGSRQKDLLLPVTISHWRNGTSQAFCQRSVWKDALLPPRVGPRMEQWPSEHLLLCLPMVWRWGWPQPRDCFFLLPTAHDTLLRPVTPVINFWSNCYDRL